MKKMVSVFLMMLLVVTALASSAWAEGKIQPFYNQTARISASLVINGSTAECMGKIIPNSDATVSSMTMKLQQKKDGDGFHKDSLIVASTRIFFKHLIGKL